MCITYFKKYIIYLYLNNKNVQKKPKYLNYFVQMWRICIFSTLHEVYPIVHIVLKMHSMYPIDCTPCTCILPLYIYKVYHMYMYIMYLWTCIKCTPCTCILPLYIYKVYPIFMFIMYLWTFIKCTPCTCILCIHCTCIKCTPCTCILCTSCTCIKCAPCSCILCTSGHV